MQGTRLGISTALLGAAVYVACGFGGIVPAILLAGYVLLFEGDWWLRRTAVKAVSILFTFEIIIAFLDFIPDSFGVVDGVFDAFQIMFYAPAVSGIFSAVSSIMRIIMKIIFIVMSLTALKQQTVNIGPIDSMINKHMGR